MIEYDDNYHNICSQILRWKATKMEENDKLEIIDGETTEVVNEEPDEGEASKRTNYPTQTVLTIRAIVGAYVMYLAYQIITSDNEVTIPMWIAVAVFIVAGAALVIMSVKHFICGEYEGGKKDV